MKTFSSLLPSTVATVVLTVVTVLAPLVLFPLSNSPIDTSKMIFGLVAVVCLLAAFAWQLMKLHTIRIPFHPLLLPAVLLTVSGVISSIMSTPYPQTSLLGLQGMFILSCLIMIFGGMVLRKKNSDWFIPGLVGTTVFALIWLLLQQINLGPTFFYKLLLGLPLPNGLTFNPAGSVFVLAQLSGITLVALLTKISTSITAKNRILYLIATVIVALGFLGTAWLSLPGKDTSPLMLPFEASWSVALDTLRVPKTALLGVGLSNYGDAFSNFKPGWINTTSFWNVTYTQGSSFVFTLLTGQGLLGLIAWLSLAFAVFKNYLKLASSNKILTHSFIAVLVLQVIFPASFMLLLVFGLVAAFLVSATKNQYRSFELQAWSFELVNTQDEAKPVKKYSKILVWVFSTVFILFSLALAYVGTMAFASDRAIYTAAKLSTEGNIVKVYELQQLAIKRNPYNDTLRRQYALTSISIASALSNKSDVTDQEREQITLLIQQAIREAQTATSLNPTRSQNWETLGDIYANLIGTASEAETWSAQSYNQAVTTAPKNPLIYIKLGGLFYRQENYQDAVFLFERAAQLKPNLANAYYNAANALKKKGDLATAENAYKQTLLILEQESGTATDEYVAATQELEELQALIKAEEKKTPATPAQTSTVTPDQNSGFAADGVSLVKESVENTTNTPDKNDQLPLN